MRKRVTYLFLLFCGLIYAQTPVQGKYCAETSAYDHQITCLELKDDGSFIYSDGGLLSGINDHFGTFVLQGDLLILDYNNQHSKPLDYHRSQIWRNDKDSISVQINVFDIEGKPLPHIFISHSGNKNPSGGLPPSFEGTADFKFLKHSGKEQITTGFVGFENYSFEIDLNYDCSIDVFLTESHQAVPIRNQVDTLRLTEVKPDSFKANEETVWKRSF